MDTPPAQAGIKFKSKRAVHRSDTSCPTFGGRRESKRPGLGVAGSVGKSKRTWRTVDGQRCFEQCSAGSPLLSVQRLFQRAAVLTELSVPIFASLVLQSVQQVFGTVFQRTRSRSVSYRDDSFSLLHVILARFRPGSRFLA